MRPMFFAALALLLAAAPQAQGQVYSFAPANATSSASVLALASARHNQQLYRPGQVLDSTLAPLRVSRIYLRLGDLANTGNQIDSLRLALGNTTLRDFRQNANFQNVFVRTGLRRVFSRGRQVINGGPAGTWFSLDLDSAFTLNPARSLVLDIRYSNASNPTMGIQGTGIFAVGARRRVVAGNQTDTAGSGSSSIVPHLGFDVATGIAPRRTLAVRAVPNPAQGSVHFSLPNPAPAMATLVAADGRRLALASTSGWEAFALPAGLAPGLYQVLLVQQGLTFRATVVVE